MNKSKLPGEIDRDRRRFMGVAAGAVAATQFGLIGRAKAQPGAAIPGPARPGTSAPFGPVKQIKAGVLNVGYVEAGPADGRPVILMHGFPYDIHSYVEVAPLLAAEGTAPFILARPDFTTEEQEPWHEDGQVWRSLLVTYPDTIVAHTRQQTYYFDDAGLLRRLDYAVDILGGGPAVHSPSQYREFDGIMVPTRRRVYVRNPDGSPVHDSVSVAIDITNVTFS